MFEPNKRREQLPVLVLRGRGGGLSTFRTPVRKFRMPGRNFGYMKHVAGKARTSGWPLVSDRAPVS
jgi:hypothetical protein